MSVILAEKSFSEAVYTETEMEGETERRRESERDLGAKCRWCDGRPRPGIHEACEVGDVVGGNDGVRVLGQRGDDYIDVDVMRVTAWKTFAASSRPQFGGCLQGVGPHGFDANGFTQSVEHTKGEGEAFEHEIAAHLIVDDGRQNDLHVVFAQGPIPKFKVEVPGWARGDESANRTRIKNDRSSRQRFFGFDRCYVPLPL